MKTSPEFYFRQKSFCLRRSHLFFQLQVQPDIFKAADIRIGYVVPPEILDPGVIGHKSWREMTGRQGGQIGKKDTLDRPDSLTPLVGVEDMVEILQYLVQFRVGILRIIERPVCTEIVG